MEELAQAKLLWMLALTVELLPILLLSLMGVTELLSRLKARRLAVSRLQELNLLPPPKPQLSRLLRVLSLRRRDPLPTTFSTD